MNTYLVMTQQIPKREFELVEAPTIVEASAHGVVMLLVHADRDDDRTDDIDPEEH